MGPCRTGTQPSLLFACRPLSLVRLPSASSTGESYSEKMPIRFVDREEVARRLTYDVCIPIVRDAMIAFSRGETRQLLRSNLPLS